MDITTIIGIALGFGGIVLGHIFEGGHFTSLVQGTAGVIVFGGTLGAVFVGNNWVDIQKAFSQIILALTKEDQARPHIIANEIVQSAKLARKEGMLAIEKKLKSYTSPYMQNVFKYMVDGVDPDRLREIFELDLVKFEEKEDSGASVWAEAGGYAPTIGIIGAVLGLIQVMSNLSNTAELGKGIAVAFVATIYGVGSANLLFLPFANKIRRKMQVEINEREMIIEGAYSILSGQNPYIVREKMNSFINTEEVSVEK